MLNHHNSIDALQLDKSWITIGIFDGVHRGHQQIIKTLTEGARARGVPSVALTFDPHPATVLAGVNIPKITTVTEKAALLSQYGVDHIITLPFTHEVAAMSAEAFIGKLKQHLGIESLVTGFDFALGRNRSGNNDVLNELGTIYGYKHQAIEALADEGTIISSTFIRNAISNGSVTSANSMLGRHYSLSGAVVHGDGRGRTINVPTCNIELPSEKITPMPGVYACLAKIGQNKHKSVANFGFRPTFTPGALTPRLEVHILDFDGDLYGQTLEIEFVQRVRPEVKFTNVQELIAQINKDILVTRTVLPA